MIQFDDINLRENNPYSVGSVFVFQDGTVSLDREPIKVDRSINDQYYSVINGDKIGKVAFEMYGNSKWWWVIADINEIEFPFELEPGTTLIIPDLNRLKAIL